MKHFAAFRIHSAAERGDRDKGAVEKMEKKGHLTTQDLTYLQQRMKTEREKAKQATDPRVAAIHSELAKHYEVVMNLDDSERGDEAE